MSEGILIGAFAKVLIDTVGKAARADERLRKFVLGDPEKKALEACLDAALTSFQREHPELVASLFDRPFLTDIAAPILAGHLLRLDDVTDQLADAWAAGFPGHEEDRAQLIRANRGLIARFLHIFDAELRKEPLFQPAFNSRVLDETAAATRDTAQSLHRLGDTSDRIADAAQETAENTRLIAARLGTPAAPHRAAAWHQLPRLPDHFCGREKLVENMAAAIRLAWSEKDENNLIQVVEGAGGLGKSTVAIAVAREIEPDFPTMQIVVPLRSHTGRPQSPEQARDALLQSIYPLEPLPADDTARWTSYQSLFLNPDGSPTPGLLIIDDCASEGQLRQLVPAAPYPVIVTTRRSFARGFSRPLSVLAPPPAPSSC